MFRAWKYSLSLSRWSLSKGRSNWLRPSQATTAQARGRNRSRKASTCYLPARKRRVSWEDNTSPVGTARDVALYRPAGVELFWRNKTQGSEESKMAKRLANIVILFCILGTGALTRAQVTLQPGVCPYYKTHPLSLACLIPETTQAEQSQNLARFNTTIAQVLGQLPLAAPVSGFVVGFDKSTGQFVPLNENLGSVLTERGNTVGRHNIFVAFTAQRFVFQTIDGNSLSNLKTVGQYATDPTPPVAGQPAIYEFESSNNQLSANLNQYTGI